jgi:2-dehydro-3-deoxyphosphooctonate aldolase (KDO 8-P synthase)
MSQERVSRIDLGSGIHLGSEQFVLIAGPCAIESSEIALETAHVLKILTERLGIQFLFKASFDKANRTSAGSYRSGGYKAALQILQQVRLTVGVPVLTDIHESSQVEAVAEVVDVLQIPAFLCRQTDLLEAAGQSGLPVNIKKGQFMAPADMQYALEKVRRTGNDRVFLTERGTSFGYHDLVVDMRSLAIMRRFAPVIFDVTHSIQQPGANLGSSGGQREFAPVLARAAAAVGVDGFFIETHPAPERALSDGPNMIPLDEMEPFLKMILDIWKLCHTPHGNVVEQSHTG